VILTLAMLLMMQGPTVEEILARYEAAVGDPAIARAYETRVVVSKSEELTGGEADVYEYFLAPGKYLRVMVRPEGATMRLGTDGKSAWSDSPRGLVVVPGEKVPAVARDSVLHWHLKLRELYPQMRVAGAAKVFGKAAWHIEATTQQGDREQMFFDAATGLLLRRQYEVQQPDGSRFQRDVVYEEYADFDGVKLPSVTRQFSPYPLLVRVERVTHNSDVYDYAFAAPKYGAAK
jgi:hypothetical protein